MKGLFNIKKTDSQRGAAAVLVAILILSVVLIIGIGSAILMMNQVEMQSEAGMSVPAFYAADSGAERCLFQARKGAAGDACFAYRDGDGDTITGSVLGGKATYSASLVSDHCIESTGSYSRTRRKVELNWGAVGEPCR